MKQIYRLLLATFLMLPNAVTYGQSVCQPKFAFAASDTATIIPATMRRATNYNPSVSLADSVLTFAIDSLRTDGTATIITVYETSEDRVVGLWQIGSGANRVLWLNSRQASYEDFSIRYRSENEQGSIIHTMHYAYPDTDSLYDGHDTLFIGREGGNIGNKNFCALYYFKDGLSAKQQRIIESMLAIRYGALLHGPYLTSRQDTLWHTRTTDNPYSSGVCGIGRDDSLGLSQNKSIIAKDILTISTVDAMEDNSFVMMGHDGGGLTFDNETVWVDSVQFLPVARTWKLRSHMVNNDIGIRLLADMPFSANAIRMLITSDGGTSLHIPAADSIRFDSIILTNGAEYYVTILVNADSVTSLSPDAKSSRHNEEADHTATENIHSLYNHDSRYTITPNPTTGHFTLHIDQPEEDLVNIWIHDAKGRTIEQYVTPEPVSQHTYDGRLKAGGIYYVTVTSNGRSETIKLIVVR